MSAERKRARERYRLNTDDCLRKLYLECERSRAKMSERTGIPDSSIGRWIRDHKITTNRWEGHTPKAPQAHAPREARAEKPGITLKDNSATLIGAANPMSTSTLSPEDLFKLHKLDPTDWTFKVTLNRWDVLAGSGKVTTMAQLKIHAERLVRIDMITPPRAPGYRPLKKHPKPSTTKPETVIVCSDPHHPFIDRNLEQCMLQMLADLKPARAFDLGDGLDLSTPSRFRKNPGHDADPQACVDSEYTSWLARVSASPQTKWTRLPGNHDERIKNAQLDRISAIYGLRKAQTVEQIEKMGETLPVLDIAYLLRLDELGVTMHHPPNEGQYHSAKIQIAPGLLASHGTKAGKHGGATTVGPTLTCSWMQGHDHKQALAYLTRYDDQQRAGDAALCSVGTLAVRDLGYSEIAQAQQGLSTVTVWPDGRFHIELARYDDGELVWRDRRYKA